MKATIAVTCFLSAVVVIFALTEQECREPRPSTMCTGGVVTDQYYFSNHTNRCEHEVGCGTGKNNFLTEEECRVACPYGQ
uniref:Putative salivary kunitz domain protein n=1 Tax=Ixodes ricinus TaxID=34613 RepID=A0A0K8RFE3_IXORI